MVSVWICVENAAEREQAAAVFREVAARMSEDEWRILPAEGLQLPEGALADMLLCDVTGEGALDRVRGLRAACREAMLLLIADGKMSPLEYLRPQILASSLLLKPYRRKQLEQVLGEFIGCWLSRAPDPGKSLVIKTEQGRLVIPYSRICYLEAREKKVFVRLLSEEYSFYDTLGHIEEGLPEYFVRTHRSYIVNGRQIEGIRLADGLVTLRDGFQIPVSRSCRARVKEFENEQSG